MYGCIGFDFLIRILDAKINIVKCKDSRKILRKMLYDRKKYTREPYVSLAEGILKNA